MQFFTNLRGSGRGLIMLAAVGCLALGLTACSDTDESSAASPFSQALAKDYGDLAAQAAALPVAPQGESGFLDSLNPFGSDESSSDRLAKVFTAKAEAAQGGAEPEPEAAPGPDAATFRTRLVNAIATGKDQFPEQAARAQADYDCWVIYGNEPATMAASRACKMALDSSLLRLETAARPAPPVPAPVPMAAPVAAPAPAPAGDFTVYFDFDSWTLKAEELKVLDQVIATARNGGQSNITIVGHTDTSGSNEYNQKLSVHRANVVVEALTDMGARKAALHASGVGETDLAFPTPDGVKEAKNRRTVITLQP